MLALEVVWEIGFEVCAFRGDGGAGVGADGGEAEGEFDGEFADEVCDEDHRAGHDGDDDDSVFIETGVTVFCEVFFEIAHDFLGHFLDAGGDLLLGDECAFDFWEHGQG